jgi:hypothetical protein
MNCVSVLISIVYVCAKSFTSSNNNVFGSWTSSMSFNWTLDANAPNAPTWTDSRNTVRRDHWHMSGNDRLNMLMSDRGTVALFATDRGERWLNELDESRLQLGGAFSYVRLANGLYCTAFQDRSPQEFGVGNVRSSRVIGGALRMDRRVFAPFGNHSFVVDMLNVTNVGGSPLSFQLTEFFDVNQLQLAIDWVVTGVAGTVAHDARRAINALFRESCAPLVANDSSVLRAAMAPLSSTTSAYVDTAPPHAFAAVVDGWSLAATHCDQRAFFGVSGNATQPAALLAATVSSSVLRASNAYEQNAMLAFTFQPVTLLPGRSLSLSFVFGFAADDRQVRATVDAVRSSGANALWKATQRAWQNTVVRVTFNDTADADVARETAWRTANRAELGDDAWRFRLSSCNDSGLGVSVFARRRRRAARSVVVCARGSLLAARHCALDSRAVDADTGCKWRDDLCLG